MVVYEIKFDDRKQSAKSLLTIDERRSKIARNSAFDCHASPVGLQTAIEKMHVIVLFCC